MNELKLVNDTLEKENIVKEREIQKLSDDLQQLEQTIQTLRMQGTPPTTASTRDVEVAACLCCRNSEHVDEEGERSEGAGKEVQLKFMTQCPESRSDASCDTYVFTDNRSQSCRTLSCNEADNSMYRHSEVSLQPSYVSCTDSDLIGGSLPDQINYYRFKLMSVMQILENKEEMVKIQTQSLELADVRISGLTARNTQLQAELEKKLDEVKSMQRSHDRTCGTNVISRMDCSCGLQKENDSLKLRNELLCNEMAEYEARVVDLENIVTTNSQTIEQCQDIIRRNNAEMDRQHSTMRECTEQLAKTREEWSARECILCSQLQELQARNCEAQQQIQDKERKLQDKKQKLQEKEQKIQDKQRMLEEKHQKLEEKQQKLEEKEQKLEEKEHELVAARKTIDGLKERVRNMKFDVKCRSTDMEQLRCLCENHECTIKTLKEENNTLQVCINKMNEQNVQLRNELSSLNIQADAWRTHLADSNRRLEETDRELTAIRITYEQLQCSYRSKSESVAWLESELAEASSRGATLCAESRHVVNGLREWMRRMRQQHLQQQQMIQELQRRLHDAKQRLTRYEGRSCCPSVCPAMSASCANVQRSRSHCSLTAFTDCESNSTQTTMSAAPSPSPPPPRARRTPPCRSCDLSRTNSTLQSPLALSEELMMAIDNMGSSFYSTNSQFTGKTKPYSTRQHP